MQKITLKHPVSVDNLEYTEISMRRPKVRDMLDSDKTGGSAPEKEVRLFANLCEISPEVVQELDIADYKTMQETYQSFLSS